MTALNIEESMKALHIQGLTITTIKNKKIFQSEQYGVSNKHDQFPVMGNTMFNVCSISKLLTTVLACKLIDEQLLQLDTPINELATTWTISSNTPSPSLTLRQLLSHQSGIIDPPNSFLPYQKRWGYPTVEQLFLGKTEYCREPIIRQENQVGRFHYADANFCLIEKLIEGVTGKSFTLLMEEKVLQPLGMACSTYEVTYGKNISQGHDRNGATVKEKYPHYPYPAASGLWSTSKDISKLMIELMDAIVGDSKLGLSPLTINEMFTSQGECEWLGLGCFLGSTSNGFELSSLGWGVGFQSLLALYPQKKEGIIILTNTELGIHQMDGLIGEIYRAFIGKE
ncbi:serine hydrolase domain-containing protein [Cytobacillus kochii]